MIKALEKYKSIVQNFSYLYGAVLIQNLVSLVLTFYLVRALSETQYAEYSLILAYINIFASFSLTGLGEAVMQSTARKKIGIYLNAQKAMLLASTISAIIFIALAYFHKLSNDHSEALYLSMAAAAILFPFYKGLTIWKNFKNGKQEFKQLSIINVSSSVITNFLIIYLLIIDISESYIPLIIIYLLIPSLINVYMFFNDYFHHNIKNNEDIEDGIFKYGAKISIYSAIHTIALKIDSFILFYFISPQIMALFTVANKIPEIIRGFTQTLGAVLAPRFAQIPLMTSKMNNLINIYSFTLGIGIIIFTFTLYPMVMELLFSNKYNDAIFYSQIIMCSLIIGNIANLNFRFVRSKQDEKNYKKVMITISVVKIASALILVPLYGVWGAIYSIFIYRLTMMVVVKYIIYRDYNPTKQKAS